MDNEKRSMRFNIGSDSPSLQASSEKEIGTAKAKAPIVIWLASSRLKLELTLALCIACLKPL